MSGLIIHLNIKHHLYGFAIYPFEWRSYRLKGYVAFGPIRVYHYATKVQRA